MSDQEPRAVVLTSQRSVVTSLLAALALAAVLLITVVLPAEYDIDPTGIGKMLGVDVLSDGYYPTPPEVQLPETQPHDNASPRPAGSKSELRPQPPEEIPGLAVPAPLKNPTVIQRPGTTPRTETLDVTLALYEEVELKAVMDAAQTIVYSWSISDGEVYYDFHAEPDEGPEGYFVRYAEGEGNADSGSLVAPFTGHHGWYWLNISDHAITVRLEVAGYHKKLVEVYRGRQGL